MSNRVRPTVLLCAAAVMTAGLASRQVPTIPAPDVVGDWAGTWSSYNPAKGADAPKQLCAKLDAKVVKEGDVWKATFTGDCGRPYKYTITMEGRQAGKVVMFKGSADLGPRDGGVYDWIGRATDQEFVGFFTSSGYTGVFSLSRSKVEP